MYINSNFTNTKKNIYGKDCFMKKILTSFTLFILFVVFLFCITNNYTNAVSSNLSNNFFRLHILANSDSKSDQELKLKVRDNIIKYMNNQNFKTKAEASNYVQNNLSKFYEIAEQTIFDNGYNYSVNIQIGNFYFPTKNYGNISLPAGFYDGIKIEIGEAEGQNWWCSLFPPLCFVDISSGVVDEENLKSLEENLNNEEFNLITSSSDTIKFKFKIIELLNNN